jgi:hypothetical protein
VELEDMLALMTASIYGGRHDWTLEQCLKEAKKIWRAVLDHKRDADEEDK